MQQQPAPILPQRSLWSRGLLMLLMGLAYQLASSLLLCVAIVQFVVVLALGAPNQRLKNFGANLGLYLGQIAQFQSFAADALPFPFADWPSDA